MVASLYHHDGLLREAVGNRTPPSDPTQISRVSGCNAFIKFQYKSPSCRPRNGWFHAGPNEPVTFGYPPIE